MTSMILIQLLCFALVSCQQPITPITSASESASAVQPIQRNRPPTKVNQVIVAALEQVNVTTEYDPAYVKLEYPNGDVPLTTGVCADVIIRAFRRVEVDLQKELHEDMKSNFRLYPKKWGAKAPDKNIDHRRVPNLMTWFERQNKALTLSSNAEDYLPGDVVAWDLGGGLTHIGLISDLKATNSNRYQIVHNIGSGTKIEDRLFDWKVIGHYRYYDNADSDQQNAETAPRIGTIKQNNLPDECGCSLWLLSDYTRANLATKRKIVFFSELDDYARINVDGKDVRFEFVAASTPPLKEKVGHRSWKKFKAGDIQVEISFIATKTCNERDESCEMTHYKAEITVKRGKQKSVVTTKGFCGC